MFYQQFCKKCTQIGAGVVVAFCVKIYTLLCTSKGVLFLHNYKATRLFDTFPPHFLMNSYNSIVLFLKIMNNFTNLLCTFSTPGNHSR